MAKVKVYKKGVLTEIEKEYAERLVEGDVNFSFEPTEEEVEVIEADKKASLMEAYSVKFGKDAPPNIKIETLEAKLLENNE